MEYKNSIRAVFSERPNRFIARVRLGGAMETVHVKNTGRCRELLVPGCSVVLTASDNPARKTKYDLIAVEKPGIGLVNIDSQAANDAAAEWLHQCAAPGDVIRREVTHGGSRFDFCIESGGMRTFLEVKGVTLERDGVALFPDAPTERGVKHIRELISCREQGIGARLLFVVQMKGVHTLRPNDAMHAAFGDALRDAIRAGVDVTAMDCIIGERSMTIDAPVTVEIGTDGGKV